jgi:hypothetical protein
MIVLRPRRISIGEVRIKAEEFLTTNLISLRTKKENLIPKEN